METSNSQPYSHIHQCGSAVGSHCVPVYPRIYLSNDPTADLVRTARALNAAMPEHVVQRLADVTGGLRDKTVVVLGAAYQGGVKETSFSGVFPIVDALLSTGARAQVHDPMYSDDELVGLGLQPHELGRRVDASIIQADHSLYRDLTEADLPGVQVVIDGRNILPDCTFPGIPVLAIGTGDPHQERAVGTRG